MQNSFVVWCLYLLNLIFALLGLALSVSMVILYIFSLSSSQSIPAPAILWSLVILGVFIAITAVVGCCGLCLRSKLFLFVYAFVILALLVISIALTVLLYQPNLNSASSQSMIDFIRNNAKNLPLDLGYIMIGAVILEAIVLGMTCIMLGSQRKTKSGFYAGRVPAGLVQQHQQMQMQALQQQQGPLYTGPRADMQEEIIEYEVVSNPQLPEPTLPNLPPDAYYDEEQAVPSHQQHHYDENEAYYPSVNDAPRYDEYGFDDPQQNQYTNQVQTGAYYDRYHQPHSSSRDPSPVRRAYASPSRYPSQRDEYGFTDRKQ